MWNTFQSLLSGERYDTQVLKMYEKNNHLYHPKTGVIGRVIFKVKAMKRVSTGTRRQLKRNVILGLKNLDSRLRTSEDFREKMGNIDERIFAEDSWLILNYYNFHPV